MLKSPEFYSKNLIRRSNVEALCTTDDPADDLKYHEQISADKSFNTKVLPTFRPDNAINIEKDTFTAYIKKSGDVCGFEIMCFNCLKKALKMRIEFFKAHGCKLSDHSLATAVYSPCDDKEASEILKKGTASEPLTALEIAKHKTAVMVYLGEEYAKNDFTMQLHFGALRNNNTSKFNALGADKGFDSIDDLEIAQPLSRFLDALEQKDALHKTILYTLNPKDNYVVGTMLGNFQQGGIKGKIQFGSGWWFNDQMDGMKKQMTDLANSGVLAAFVGMLTDSRSFTSYPRHEYFRRIMCNLIGKMVDNGEFPADMEILGKIVSDISYYNAKNYFNF